MSATFVRMQISSFVRIRSRKETSSIALSTAHCEILSLLIIRVFKVAVTANYTCTEKIVTNIHVTRVRMNNVWGGPSRTHAMSGAARPVLRRHVCDDVPTPGRRDRQDLLLPEKNDTNLPKK